MSLAEWDASALPPKARYSAFGEALSESHLGWDVYGGTSDFSAVIRRRNLDQIDFVSCSCDPCEGTRTKALIDQAGAASVGILFELSGREIVRQGERETQLSPGEFVVWDGAKPMEFRVTEPLEKLSLFVPKSVLRRHGIDIEQATSGPLGRNSRLAPIVPSATDRRQPGGSLRHRSRTRRAYGAGIDRRDISLRSCGQVRLAWRPCAERADNPIHPRSSPRSGAMSPHHRGGEWMFGSQAS